MPDAKSIRKDVFNFLEAFSRVPADEIEDTDRLAIELHLDHASHVFLAMSLRGYIQSISSEQTLKTSEIEKDGFRAIDLIDLVTQRVGQ